MANEQADKAGIGDQPPATTVDLAVRDRWWWAKSRKVQTAVVTLVVAIAAKLGLQLDPEAVLSIVGLGMIVILSIAHEDAAAKGAATNVTIAPEDPEQPQRPGS